MEKQKTLLMGSKGQVQGIVLLLAMILVGGVGGIISLSLFNAVLTPSSFSQNANLLQVQNTYIPLFIVAIVAGAVISGLIYGILFVLGRAGGGR